MKRAGNLIEKIVDLDNIRYAFYLASRGRHKKKAVQEYLFRDNEKDFAHIREMLLSKNVQVGDYHFFKVYEPKERMIYASAFSERVLQHAIMRVCSPIFEKFQISNSYACRKGKGQYKALEQARKNHAQTQWFVKMDIRKYFDSIDHAVLKTLLRRRFKDAFVIDAFDKIIDSYCVPVETYRDTSLHNGGQRGLPIGNLTSQYFANHYLAVADHFIKEELKVKRYVRYMDDMVIWGDDKHELLRQCKAIKDFCLHRLKLELKEIVHNKTGEGLTFLGYRIMKNHLCLSNSSKKRYKAKIALYRALYNSKIWSSAAYYVHASALTSFVLHADTLGLRRCCAKGARAYAIRPYVV